MHRHVSLIFLALGFLAPPAYAIQESVYVVEPIHLRSLERAPVQGSPDALPKGVAGALPTTDGEAFYLDAEGAELRGASFEDLDASLTPILQALGWTGKLADLEPIYQGEERSRVDAEALKSEEAVRAREFNAALEARLGTLSEETRTAVQDATAELVSRLQRPEVLWRFDQVIEGIPVQGRSLFVVTDGQTLRSVTGSLFLDTRLANRVALDPQTAQEMALRHVSQVQEATLGDLVQEVIVADGPDLRIAFQVEVVGEDGPYHVWVDAEQGEVLQVEPQFAAVSAQGQRFHPDPGVAATLSSFEVDAASEDQYILNFSGILTLTNDGADGTTGEPTLPDDGSGSANFDVSPFNSTANVTDSTATGYNSWFQHVNVYSWLYEVLDGFQIRGSETLPEWSLTTNGKNACGWGKDNACGGAGSLVMGIGSATLGLSGIFNTGLDATAIIHETAHGVNRLQMAVGGGSMNGSWDEGVADYFAMAFLGTDLVGSWVVGGAAHTQGGGLPRQSEAQDVFPEHLYLGAGNNEIHANGQVIGWALWSARAELVARNPLGAYAADVYTLRALRTSGLGQSGNQTDKDIHSSFLAILRGMMAAAGNSQDALDILAGFARAGLVVTEREAIISISDDYLAATGPAPSFSVWTGRDFTFTGTTATAATVYNTRYEVEVSNDPSFTVGVVSSGERSDVSVVNGVPTATWQMSEAEWDSLNDQHDLYYRLTTWDDSGANVRTSTHWLAEAVEVPVHRAVVNTTGTMDEECACDQGCATAEGRRSTSLWGLALGALLLVRRRRAA